MVLEFGGISSPLFKNSSISGQGLSANSDQSVLNDNTDEATVQGTSIDFTSIAAQGTMTGASSLNDNNTSTLCSLTGIGSYAIVSFPSSVRLQRYRHYGNTLNTDPCRMKFQYLSLNTGTYVDWVTNISLGSTAAWTDYTTVSPVTTTKIKVVATGIGSSFAGNIGELEIIY